MKILIYGAQGWIGTMFVELLEKIQQKEKNIKFMKGYARVDCDQDVIKEIKDYQPSHVISFIGRTHGQTSDGQVYSTIDYLEQKGKLVDNLRDNLYSPMLLALLANKYNYHFTYLGTGCIFEYDQTHPYPTVTDFNNGLSSSPKDGFTEKDYPNFFGSSYSIVKGFTDRLVHHIPILNLRIRMPITNTNHPRNFITKIVNYSKICSEPNSMTVLPELLPFVVTMMKEKLTGTLNLVNPGVITHNRILHLYRELVNPNHSWENFTRAQQNDILAAKRSNNYLETFRLENIFPNVLPIEEAVKKMLLTYQN